MIQNKFLLDLGVRENEGFCVNVIESVLNESAMFCAGDE